MVEKLLANLLVLFRKFGHAVMGARILAALGFGCISHDSGVVLEACSSRPRLLYRTL